MNVALYPRVSTQEQSEHGYSIGEQTERLKQYCKAMGWNVYDVYTDSGFSGANMERPALQKLIADIKTGNIDKVLVYKLDRLSRSQKDTLYLIEDVFIANGVDFVSMSENFDTATPFGKAMIGILAVFAQLEREQIKERITMGRVARAKQGYYHGGATTPIGYNYQNGELIIDEYEKMLVQEIYSEFLSGKSIRRITTDLNEKGTFHHKSDDGKWVMYTVRSILKNRVYTGEVSFSRKWYQGNHEPIIDKETFEKAQNLLVSRANDFQNKKHNTAVKSYLGGLLYCAHCGAKYAKKKANNSGGYCYYMCLSRSKVKPEYVIDPNCKNKNWNTEKLDKLVFDEIRKIGLDESYIDSIQQETPQDTREDTIKAELAKVDTQINRLIDLYSVGDIPSDNLQSRIKALQERKNNLKQQLDAIEKERQSRLSKKETLTLVQSFSDILDTGTFEQIRLVITSLIDRITIDNDDITIYWKFA